MAANVAVVGRRTKAKLKIQTKRASDKGVFPAFIAEWLSGAVEYLAFSIG